MAKEIKFTVAEGKEMVHFDDWVKTLPKAEQTAIAAAKDKNDHGQEPSPEFAEIWDRYLTENEITFEWVETE